MTPPVQRTHVGPLGGSQTRRRQSELAQCYYMTLHPHREKDSEVLLVAMNAMVEDFFHNLALKTVVFREHHLLAVTPAKKRGTGGGKSFQKFESSSSRTRFTVVWIDRRSDNHRISSPPGRGRRRQAARQTPPQISNATAWTAMSFAEQKSTVGSRRWRLAAHRAMNHATGSTVFSRAHLSLPARVDKQRPRYKPKHLHTHRRRGSSATSSSSANERPMRPPVNKHWPRLILIAMETVSAEGEEVLAAGEARVALDGGGSASRQSRCQHEMPLATQASCSRMLLRPLIAVHLHLGRFR